MGGMLSMPKSSKRKKTARKRSTKSVKRSASASKSRKGTKKVYKYPHGNHSHKKMKALKSCK
jgi:hypothetical protein